MRISDWSSDVCSSDLLSRRRHRCGEGGTGAGDRRSGREDRHAGRSAGQQRLPPAQGRGGCGEGGRGVAPSGYSGDPLHVGGGDGQPSFPGAGGAELWRVQPVPAGRRSEEHTSELQSLMRISYAVFCLKKKKTQKKQTPKE